MREVVEGFHPSISFIQFSVYLVRVIDTIISF